MEILWVDEKEKESETLRDTIRRFKKINNYYIMVINKIENVLVSSDFCCWFKYLINKSTYIYESFLLVGFPWFLIDIFVWWIGRLPIFRKLLNSYRCNDINISLGEFKIKFVIF